MKSKGRGAVKAGRENLLVSQKKVKEKVTDGPEVEGT